MKDLFDVFQMKILNGRPFSTEFKGDTITCILNEKAVQVMGMKTDNAIGKQITLWEEKGTIVGVVKDFNFKPVQQTIEPLIIGLNRWGGPIAVRTQPGKTQATIKALEKISTQLNPAYPFSFGFLDQDLANLYKGEEQMGKSF